MVDKSKSKTDSTRNKPVEKPVGRLGEKYGVSGQVSDERRRKEQEMTRYEPMVAPRPAIAHMRSHKLKWKKDVPKEPSSSPKREEKSKDASKSKDVEKSKDREKSKDDEKSGKSEKGFSSKQISEEVSEMFPPAVVISLCIPAAFILYYLYTN